MGCQSRTMQHAFYVNMGGLRLLLPGSVRFQASQSCFVTELENGIQYEIRHDDLILSAIANFLSPLVISANELEERSKSGQFAQVVTSAQ